MRKGKYHDDGCSFCNSPATKFTSYITGEPVSLCENKQCQNKFDDIVVVAHQTDCPKCGSSDAVTIHWDELEDGCINAYHRTTCKACEYSDGNPYGYSDC
jgi:hypothetical protein